MKPQQTEHQDALKMIFMSLKVCFPNSAAPSRKVGFLFHYIWHVSNIKKIILLNSTSVIKIKTKIVALLHLLLKVAETVSTLANNNVF